MLKFFRINTVPAEEHDESATWLDLFFDLIYVAILIELGNRLSSNFSLQGTIEFAFIFVPILWSWLGIVFYTRYFPTDDIGQRILTVAYMAVVIVMAFEIHSITAETATAFVITYGIIKFLLALMYGRAWLHYPEYRSMTGHYAVVYTFAGLLWLLIGLVAPTNLVLWGVALAVTIFAPVYLRLLRNWLGRSELHHPPEKHHYLMHRFGELTIIVLGEFFVKLITSSSGRELIAFNFYIGGCLLAISVSIWWLYFDHLGHASLTAKRSKIGLWIYNHYPLLAAITAYGVVGNKVFVALPGEPLADDKRLLLCISLAIGVLALGIVEWASPEKAGPRSRPHQMVIRIVSAIVLLGLAIAGGQLGAGLLVSLIALIFLIQVGLDVYMRVVKNQAESAQDLTTSAAGHA